MEYYENYLEVLSIEAFKSTDYLTVNKSLIRRFGVVDAILLSNYIDKYLYFKKEKQNFNGWFFLRHADIKKDLKINDTAIRNGKERFRKHGILAIKKRGVPAKEWLSINFKKLLLIVKNLEVTIHEGLEVTIHEGLEVTIHEGLNNNNNIIINNNNKLKNNKEKKKSSPFFGLEILEGFQSTVQTWLDYKKERGQMYKSKTGFKTFYENLLQYSNKDPDLAKQIVERSLGNNWAGIFPMKDEFKKQTKITRNTVSISRTIQEEVSDTSQHSFLKQTFNEIYNREQMDREKLLIAILSLYHDIVSNRPEEYNIQVVMSPAKLILNFVYWVKEQSWLTNPSESIFTFKGKVFQSYVQNFEKVYFLNPIKCK